MNTTMQNIIMLGVFLLLCCPLSALAEKFPFEKLQGYWEDGVSHKTKANCINNSHHFEFSSDNKRMSIINNKETVGPSGQKEMIFHYSLLSVNNRSIHVKLENEQKVDITGQPITWDLVLIDDSTYGWHRHDWPKNYFGSKSAKCLNAVGAK